MTAPRPCGATSAACWAVSTATTGSRTTTTSLPSSASSRGWSGGSILDADHHLIPDAIDELAAVTQASLRRLGQAEGVMTSDQKYSVDDLAATVDRIAPLLRQHLADEEDIVIPLILERAKADPEFGA